MKLINVHDTCSNESCELSSINCFVNQDLLPIQFFIWYPSCHIITSSLRKGVKDLFQKWSMMYCWDGQQGNDRVPLIHPHWLVCCALASFVSTSHHTYSKVVRPISLSRHFPTYNHVVSLASIQKADHFFSYTILNDRDTRSQR